MFRVFFSIFIILNTLCSFIAGETGCPPPEDIERCQCIKYPAPRLICRNIKNSRALEDIFEASKRYSFQEVHIIESVFQYIPVEIFEKASIKELYLTNTTVSGLFDGPVPEDQHPVKVQLENSRVMRSVTGTNFTSFTNLKELSVRSTPVNSLSANYGYSLPSNLKILSFYATGLKKIRPGALSLHPNLEKFAVESNKLTQLSRDIFSVPFNVRILNFDFNRISTIPRDLFHNMPNLQFLSMKNNLISTIPEAAFYGRVRNIPYFNFDGNPLQCDCKSLWIIKNKPEILGGNCTYPAQFNGRRLQDLKISDFSC